MGTPVLALPWISPFPDRFLLPGGRPPSHLDRPLPDVLRTPTFPEVHDWQGPRRRGWHVPSIMKTTTLSPVVHSLLLPERFSGARNTLSTCLSLVTGLLLWVALLDFPP